MGLGLGELKASSGATALKAWTIAVGTERPLPPGAGGMKS